MLALTTNRKQQFQPYRLNFFSTFFLGALTYPNPGILLAMKNYERSKKNKKRDKQLIQNKILTSNSKKIN
jgi:hypothetical protein